MLDRFVPVAGMLLPDDRVPRQRMLEYQHRAELRLAGDRPSLVGRFAARAVDRARGLFAPAPAACPDHGCPA